MKALNESGYWMGWITAVTVCCICCAALAAKLFASEMVCTGVDDEHCLREWVSALGSWAAVPAAVITVVFLSKQIAQTQNQHQERLEIDLRPSVEIAKKAKEVAKLLIPKVNDIKKLWNVPYEDRIYPDFGQTHEFHMLFLDANLENDIFDRFEKEVTHVSSPQLAWLRSSIACEMIVNRPCEESDFPYVRQQVLIQCDLFCQWMERCVRAADEYISDCDRKIGKQVVTSSADTA
ncbi:hypothetical protein RRU01S_31_00100 [Agrobacterium rubi TR3 = NBRC 13261]|uniref:Uncharacterized protein n=1 Tax=Agrobacterium rubi TR3 = NBRC 13261 TaxID=1368415 RepID=A0A081D2D0_9HYPH|nr:hypothetical protein [Agrobacterium rubi]MBP1881365.1 hypothetical protein [Agrobacterium rubi]GAK73076.1 hypothetical protein RRU01S_31_00100 [Agrobacterium rubi TR3 = NBRC 13261]